MISQHTSSFLQELAKLNPAQKAAVDQTEGPVLVLAGPGTGKTQLLSARIGNILLNTDTQSANILCLTYTDAGTVAMRKRLLKFIGPEAYRVNIFTFHAFCNTVIQENLEYFGVRNLQPISELESIDLFCKLIDQFSSDNPLKKYSGDLYSNADRLKGLFTTMKAENFSVDWLNQRITEYLESLPFREEYIYKKANASRGIKAGDPKTKLLEEQAEKVENLRAAVNQYPAYEKLMFQMERYDFQDMINWVVKGFKENDNLLAKYQERYLYILVDEYQDTNGAQNEILNQLTDFWESPNLFVVGDDDQSIYSFQGANLRRIQSFVEKYESDLFPVVLTENYRSSQNILDASRSLIENNLERLIYNEKLVEILPGLHKNLEAKNEFSLSETGPVEIREYLNSLHEEAGIVKEINQAFISGDDLSEIVVIYRSHRHIANIIKSFDHLKIPYNARLKVNILELPFIQNIITILSYLSQESEQLGHGEHLLFELMHYEFFNIDPRDIAIIAKDCSIKDKGEFKSWRKLIGSRSRMLNLGLVTAGAISTLEENLTHWLADIHNHTLQTLFEKMITYGNIISYIMKSEDKVWLLEVLNTFFDFLKDESSKKPKIKIKEFLHLIKRMEDNHISLPLNKITNSEKGVNLITAHSSKGLEFKTVYAINSNADCWEKKRGNSFQFKLPDTVTFSSVVDKTEEERRLFYVAMTRAKEKLIISYPAMKMSDKDKEQSTLEKSIFVAEIQDKLKIKTDIINLTSDELSAFTIQSITTPDFNQFQIEKEFIAAELKNYKLSVTHLSKYLRCPVTFYFENILKVPAARSASMGFGKAIHYALEKLFATMKAEKEKGFPGKNEFLNFFKIGMSHSASHFTEEEFQIKIEFAEKFLPEYYNQYVQDWNNNVQIEYRVNIAEFEGIPITGALDKIEFTGNNCNVVDYKTGDPTYAKDKLKAPGDKDPLGGDYWRQVVFYKILLQNEKFKKWDMVSGEIDFIQKPKGKGEFEKYKIYVKPDDILFVGNQIKETYNNIMSHKFSPGCGKEDCRWCNFVKYNYRANTLKSQPEILVEE